MSQLEKRQLEHCNLIESSTNKMKIICDIGIIRGESWSTIEGLRGQLHVPKIAVRELLGTSDWKGTEYKRVISALEKIQFLQKDTHFNLIQPEEIILSASGITSLPPLQM